MRRWTAQASKWGCASTHRRLRCGSFWVARTTSTALGSGVAMLSRFQVLIVSSGFHCTCNFFSANACVAQPHVMLANHNGILLALRCDGQFSRTRLTFIRGLPQCLIIFDLSMRVAGGTAHQLLPQGHPLLGAGAWSKYHCAVSRHKDSEPQSVASRLDGYHPEAPAVSLDSFLDGDRASKAAPSQRVPKWARQQQRPGIERGHCGMRLALQRGLHSAWSVARASSDVSDD